MKPQSAAPYGTWTKAGVPFTIAYSLPAFHEIDFLVNEGYRRIPHGGIEHGGLIFGRRDTSSITIESFRQIECEHAAGPGFSLSPRDMENIGTQLKNCESDADLQGIEPLGWFVSYSRRDLVVSPAEFESFRALFPLPWQAMFLVKPAKFKPTQFAVLFPNQDGLAAATVVLEPFSLPSPSRKVEPARLDRTEEMVRIPSPVSAFEADDVRAAVPIPAKRARKTAKKTLVSTEVPHEQPHLAAELAPSVERASGVRSKAATRIPVLAAAVAILAMAACGSWFYLRYEAPPVQLHITAAAEGIVVTWPAGETSNAKSAELRIWTGQTEHAVELSPAEKIAGRAVLPTEDNDITVELLSRHWLHDRRGMIRLLRLVGNPRVDNPMDSGNTER